MKNKTDIVSTQQFYETYRSADKKLSPLVREIAPSAEQVFRDQYVMEFIGGGERIQVWELDEISTHATNER